MKMICVDRSKCNGCGACQTICSLTKKGSIHPTESRMQLRRAGGVQLQYTTYCQHCADPACLNACPMKAIYVEEGTGIRKIDAEKCVGCGMCAEACPWHMPRIDVETRKSTKCVSCGACVAGCPTSALKMVLWEDIAAAL